MEGIKKKNRLFCLLAGAVCGFLNGFFGAGGGTVAVPLLRRVGLSEQEAHATSVAVIFAVTAVSAVFYLVRGSVHFSDCLAFLLPGLLGAVVGAALLKRVSGPWLQRVFGALIAVAAVRMLLR